MAGTLSVIKVLIVPAIVSLTIFLLLTFILLPFWRRSRLRYAQYLPLHSLNVNLEGLSSRTSSLRDRITESLLSLASAPARRANRPTIGGAHLDDDDDDDDDDYNNTTPSNRITNNNNNNNNSRNNYHNHNSSTSPHIDGEELSAVHVDNRPAWESQARASRPDHTRRLSRELEEGFRDDSDEESDP